MSKENYVPKQYKNIDTFVQKMINKGVDPGVFCTEVDEHVPSFQRASCEKVIKNSNNAFIVLGRDRPESLASGAGGAGHTASGMIDLVVGRGATYSAKQKSPLKASDVIGPSFATDAARAYITQKCLGIDDYFGFANTKTNSHGKSAIALKADHTRLIARESVRIYCGAGSFSGPKENNSNGIALEVPKIEFIAGNENKLQPVVLGDELVRHLTKQADMTRKILISIQDIFVQLIPINTTLVGLTFGSPPFTNNLIKDLEGVMDQVQNTMKTHLEEANALNKCLLPGKNSILSNSVYTT